MAGGTVPAGAAGAVAWGGPPYDLAPAGRHLAHLRRELPAGAGCQHPSVSFKVSIPAAAVTLQASWGLQGLPAPAPAAAAYQAQGAAAPIGTQTSPPCAPQEVQQVGDALSLQPMLYVDQPALKATAGCDGRQRRCRRLCRLPAAKQAAAVGRPRLPLCYQRAKHRDAVGVGCIDPAGGRHSHEVVTEVHKCIQAVPAAEVVKVGVAATLRSQAEGWGARVGAEGAGG